MDKIAFRKKVIGQIKSMDEIQYVNRSKLIVDQLLQEKSFIDAKVIGVTISRFPEVDTKELIHLAWKLNKKVAIPKCLPRTREMDFRIFEAYDDLETVYGDLLEPIVEQTESVTKDEIDLLIVPGVVYSHNGYRIGFGGGYYDRYLVNYKGETVSLAFQEQLYEDIKVESHDIPVHKIITDREVIHCRQGNEL